MGSPDGLPEQLPAPCPGDIPTPDEQQPAPSTYMTLMYNLHYTLSTTHYHAPTDHWIVHGTDSLLPAD